MSKPDNRADNASKIKAGIDSTKWNMEASREMIAETSDEKTKKDLKSKNQRRADAISGMEKEMKQEQGWAYKGKEK